MAERSGAITMKGNPLTLVGDELKEGDTAPDCTLVANDLSDRKLSEYSGKTVILTTVPSLDTPVCDTETRKFNEQAASLGDDVQVLCVSRDLPFAQKRWCGQAGVENVEALSDYRERALGPAFGVEIKELGLLARAVFVIGPDGKVRHAQIVSEVAEEPDYEAPLKAAQTG